MGLLIVKSAERVVDLNSYHSTIFMHGKKEHLCKRSLYLNEQFLKKNSIQSVQIEYNTEDQAINSDTISLYANSSQVPKEWGEYPAVNLASIDVGELWILLRLLSQRVFLGIDFFYLVPDSYGVTDIGRSVLRKEISKSRGTWKGLPGLITAWNIDDLDFRQFSFLGFDAHRLGSIYSYEGFPDNLNKTYIIADPPTAPYWLERSLRDNHQLITDVLLDRKTNSPVERMAGMCPATTNAQLRDIRLKMSNKQRWCLLPLGPKIQTLGAILFTSNQLEDDNKSQNEPTVGVLYDFPKPDKDMANIMKPPLFYWRFQIKVL